MHTQRRETCDVMGNVIGNGDSELNSNPICISHSATNFAKETILPLAIDKY